MLFAGIMPLAAHTRVVQNSRLGLDTLKTSLQQEIEFGSSLNALGIDAEVRQTCVGSRSTGKERDSETGLDYFGARYSSSAQGRWTSPDWSASPQPVPYADLSDPQTLNLYGYVRNNPVNLVDPLGHFNCTGNNAQKVGCQYIAQWNAEHGIEPTAKKSSAPGVAVRLPNGKTVADPSSSTGVLMSPTADLRDVAAAGSRIKNTASAVAKSERGMGYGWGVLSIVAQGLRNEVRQNGDADYQRVSLTDGGLQQLPQFRNVSNFNVGLVAQQAGLSLDDVLTIAGTYARLNSSNYRKDQPYGLDPVTREWTEIGYKAGASGVYDK